MDQWLASSITEKSGWAPFQIQLQKPDLIRGMGSEEGIGDRLRVVAFAELQARDAFQSGVDRFSRAVPEYWSKQWLAFAKVEARHAQMLLDRMKVLGVSISARKVSDKLTRLCKTAQDPIVFLFCLASAEERGMEAGNQLKDLVAKYDPISAAIFEEIASEEVEHVRAAKEMLAPFSYDELREKARAVDREIFANL